MSQISSYQVLFYEDNLVPIIQGLMSITSTGDRERLAFTRSWRGASEFTSQSRGVIVRAGFSENKWEILNLIIPKNIETIQAFESEGLPHDLEDNNITFGGVYANIYLGTHFGMLILDAAATTISRIMNTTVVCEKVSNTFGPHSVAVLLCNEDEYPTVNFLSPFSGTCTIDIDNYTFEEDGVTLDVDRLGDDVLGTLGAT